MRTESGVIESGISEDSRASLYYDHEQLYLGITNNGYQWSSVPIKDLSTIGSIMCVLGSYLQNLEKWG